jgi:hypothetical protein
MKKMMALICLSFFTTVVFANSGGQVVQDGSVARCQDLSDVGYRVYRLSEVSATAAQYVFKLESLQCVLNATGSATILIPYAMSTPIVYKRNNDVLSYELLKSYISVTNNNRTVELFQISLDTKQQTQLITIDRSQLTEKSVDLTVMSLELIQINHKYFDQGLIFSGSFRILN